MNPQRFNTGLGTATPHSNNAGSFAFPTASNPAPTAAPPNPAPAPRTIAAAAAAPVTVGPVALPNNATARAVAIVQNTNTAANATQASGYAASAASNTQAPTAQPAAPYEIRQYASEAQEKAAAGGSSKTAWIVFAVLAAGAVFLLTRSK